MEKEFVGYKSGYCPNCGTEIKNYDDKAFDGKEVYFYFSCPCCGGAGCESYYLEYRESNCIIEDSTN